MTSHAATADSPSLLGTQIRALAARSLRRTLRQPAAVIPPVVFPLALMAVNAAGLAASTRLPGFPGDSFLAFALAVPFIQGALFATLNAGTELARDIQTGFINRLALTPMRSAALLAGHLVGVVVLGVIQALCYLAVGLLVGVDFAAGVGGIGVLLVFSALVSLGFGAFGSWLALRSGSGEAVQGFFPLAFVFLFISSFNAPRDLIAVDWFRIAATLNPVSYLIECVRSLIIVGWEGQTLAVGFAVAAALTVLGLALAARALQQRMTRT